MIYLLIYFITPINLYTPFHFFTFIIWFPSPTQSFKRYGVWGDWDRPYATLQPVYEAAQIKVFGQMVTKGHIYRGKKPVSTL